MGKALMMAGELDEADQAFRLGIFDVRLGSGGGGEGGVLSGTAFHV